MNSYCYFQFNSELLSFYLTRSTYIYMYLLSLMLKTPGLIDFNTIFCFSPTIYTTTAAEFLIFWPSREREELVCSLGGVSGECNDSIYIFYKFDLRIKRRNTLNLRYWKLLGSSCLVYPSGWVTGPWVFLNPPVGAVELTLLVTTVSMEVGSLPQSIFCSLISLKGVKLIQLSEVGQIGWWSFSHLTDTLSVSHCQLVSTKTVPVLPLWGSFPLIHVSCVSESSFHAITICKY